MAEHRRTTRVTWLEFHIKPALGITGSHGGRPLDEPPFELLAAEEPAALVQGPRVGISQAVERPWRYAEAGSRFLSRPLRAADTR